MIWVALFALWLIAVIAFWRSVRRANRAFDTTEETITVYPGQRRLRPPRLPEQGKVNRG